MAAKVKNTVTAENVQTAAESGTKSSGTVKKTANVDANVTRYTKAQLIRSKRFSNRRDLLTAVLEDDKVYSIAEAEAAAEKFLKGKVK